MKNKKVISLLLVVLFLLTLTACSTGNKSNESISTVTADNEVSSEKIKVIATLFPQYDFVKEIARDKVAVSLLLPPGVESHSYEPPPKDIVDIKKADMFIYTGKYMEPWADKIIEATKGTSITIVDTSIGVDLMDEEDHHHDHEEGEHPFEWAGAFELKKGKYTWSFSKLNGEYADPEMKMLILASDEKGLDAIEAVEEKAEELFDKTAASKKISDTLLPSEILFNLEFDADQDVTTFSVVIENDGTYVFFTEHFPIEFEADEHFFKDSKGIDVEPSAQEPEGDDDHHQGGKDPHIWLDPIFAQIMVDNIVEGLVRADVKNESFYRENGEAYKKKLQALDATFSETFNKTKHKTIMYGGHFAFGYFAKRYDLEHVSPYSGFAPNAEPTPQKIVELIKALEKSNLKTIYFEELVDPKVARVISDQTGAEMVLLHGVHNISKTELSKGISYLKIMEENLEKLKLGLGYNE